MYSREPKKDPSSQVTHHFSGFVVHVQGSDCSSEFFWRVHLTASSVTETERVPLTLLNVLFW